MSDDAADWTLEELSPATFLDWAKEMLEGAPVLHQIALGVATAAAASEANAASRHLFAVIGPASEDVIGTIVVDATPWWGRGARASTAGQLPLNACRRFVAEVFATRFPGLKSVCGPPGPTEAFARAYSEAIGVEAEPGLEVMGFALYKPPSHTPTIGGRLRTVAPEDTHLRQLAAWHGQFVEDAMGHTGQPAPDLDESVAHIVHLAAEGNLFVWEDEAGEPMGMACIGRRLGRTGASLSLVFVARDRRGSGVGRALVSAVCRQKLESLEFVGLFADTRPEARTVPFYESLGFEPKGMHIERNFRHLA